MFKRLKNNKGFTLIELMMVIAVIGILAAVLIPKIGSTKDNAKLAGVDANIRQVHAHVEGLVGRYKNDAQDLATALEELINEDGTPDANDIRNPFINSSYGAVLSTGTNAVVIIDDNSGDDDLDSVPATDDPDQAGQVYVEINRTVGTSNADLVNVMIVGYDQNGDQMANTLVTVVP